MSESKRITLTMPEESIEILKADAHSLGLRPARYVELLAMMMHEISGAMDGGTVALGFSNAMGEVLTKAMSNVAESATPQK